MQNPELICVTLSNGDSALFVNSANVVVHCAGETGSRPETVGKTLSTSLGIELQMVSMDVPTDNDWNWGDVYELLPPPATKESPSAMLVSLDGGVTYSAAKEGVRIIYSKVDVPGEDERGELHINASPESVIMDVWVSREEHLDHNIGTSAISIDDFIGDMVEDAE